MIFRRIRCLIRKSCRRICVGSPASVTAGWCSSKSPNAPSVGDVRVQFEAIKNGEASVLARQLKNTSEEYLTSHGTGISRITSGVVSKDAMFAAAQAENTDDGLAAAS